MAPHGTWVVWHLDLPVTVRTSYIGPESDVRTSQLCGPSPILLHGIPSSLTRTPSLQQSAINSIRGESSPFSCLTLRFILVIAGRGTNYSGVA